MGTKNNPGEFDCYANADPDEPMFVLLGRDPMAGMLVRLWVLLRRRAGDNPDKCAEALVCATALENWARDLGKQPYSETKTLLDDLKRVQAELDGVKGIIMELVSRAGSRAAIDVIMERRRQVEEEGWSPEHDDEHHWAELAEAARCYAMGMNRISSLGGMPPDEWPWDPKWWKPGEYRDNLRKAAALLLAEMERVDRYEARREGGAA